jgi:hypothetical protein
MSRSAREATLLARPLLPLSPGINPTLEAPAMADTKDKIKQKIDQGAEKAKEWTDKGVDKTKQGTKKVGEKVKQAGEKIREQGE